MTGYVYFFQAKSGLVKIGRSAKPAARLRALSGEAGERLAVLGVMQSGDSVAEESTLHREKWPTTSRWSAVWLSR